MLSIFICFLLLLRQNIAAVDDRVAASLVRRSIACKVQIKSLDLLDMALATKRRHAVSLVNDTGASAHFRVEEAWRYHVHSGKLAPFPS